MSFISIYGITEKKEHRITTTSESTHPDDTFTISLIKSEDYIKTNLKRFTILRMPNVLTPNNYFINHMKLDRYIDFII